MKKNGNRLTYLRTLVNGNAADYGGTMQVGYAYNAVNAITSLTSSTAPMGYGCAMTLDANGNITAIDETRTTVLPPNPPAVNHLYTYFTYDDLNRLTRHQTKAYQASGTAGWYWTDRKHEYDALGRLCKSGYRHYLDGGSVPAYSSTEHVYDQSGQHLQNYDGTSTYGTAWRWAGAANEHGGPVYGPNADTASTDAYNLSAMGGAGIPQRRTFVNPTPTEGDDRELWGQGRPQGKDSNTAWSTGTVSDSQGGIMQPVTSVLMYSGTVTGTDMSRVTDAREKSRIGIYGTGLSYAGSYGRVTSEIIGRDLNPLGRGDGVGYVGGGQGVGRSVQMLARIAPKLPGTTCIRGWGNSVNNGNYCGGGGPCASPIAARDPVQPPVGRAGNNSVSHEGPGYFQCVCESGIPICYGDTGKGAHCCSECRAQCWQSGWVITCCKDVNGPCHGPMGATVPGVGVTIPPHGVFAGATAHATSYQSITSKMVASAGGEDWWSHPPNDANWRVWQVGDIWHFNPNQMPSCCAPGSPGMGSGGTSRVKSKEDWDYPVLFPETCPGDCKEYVRYGKGNAGLLCQAILQHFAHSEHAPEHFRGLDPCNYCYVDDLMAELDAAYQGCIDLCNTPELREILILILDSKHIPIGPLLNTQCQMCCRKMFAAGNYTPYGIFMFATETSLGCCEKCC